MKAVLKKIKSRVLPGPGLMKPNYETEGLRPKVHIGCGPVNIEGWINIDARKLPHVHINTSVIDLADFSDGSIGEIYLCHVLEHFSFNEVEKLLRVFREKLKAGGVLRISVPDFSLLSSHYGSGKLSLKDIQFALMGGQDYEYNFHKSVFDRKNLEDLLVASGFSNVESYETRKDFGLDLGDWSTGTIKGFPVSLNLKGMKKS